MQPVGTRQGPGLVEPIRPSWEPCRGHQGRGEARYCRPLLLSGLTGPPAFKESAFFHGETVTISSPRKFFHVYPKPSRKQNRKLRRTTVISVRGETTTSIINKIQHKKHFKDARIKTHFLYFSMHSIVKISLDTHGFFMFCFYDVHKALPHVFFVHWLLFHSPYHQRNVSFLLLLLLFVTQLNTELWII